MYVILVDHACLTARAALHASREFPAEILKISHITHARKKIEINCWRLIINRILSSSLALREESNAVSTEYDIHIHIFHTYSMYIYIYIYFIPTICINKYTYVSYLHIPYTYELSSICINTYTCVSYIHIPYTYELR